MNCKVRSTKQRNFVTIFVVKGFVVFASYIYRHVVGHRYNSICASKCQIFSYVIENLVNFPNASLENPGRIVVDWNPTERRLLMPNDVLRRFLMISKYFVLYFCYIFCRLRPSQLYLSIKVPKFSLMLLKLWEISQLPSWKI